MCIRDRQAALALTAYELSKDGSSLYEMSAKAEPTEPENPDTPAQPGDSVKPGDCSGKPEDKNDPINPGTGVLVTGGMAVLISGAVMLISKKKRK